ncbi:hypothetical protein [Roseibium sp. MMSF_3544]|uniref:hypothetical protein n=1 Tax=unclassified Roseibium TaxID=2629323 RepID=UPI00273E6652|nr:hypothetical protein [Roseibium sp. MMSF_3544]
MSILVFSFSILFVFLVLVAWRESQELPPTVLLIMEFVREDSPRFGTNCSWQQKGRLFHPVTR